MYKFNKKSTLVITASALIALGVVGIVLSEPKIEEANAPSFALTATMQVPQQKMESNIRGKGNPPQDISTILRNVSSMRTSGTVVLGGRRGKADGAFNAGNAESSAGIGDMMGGLLGGGGGISCQRSAKVSIRNPQSYTNPNNTEEYAASQISSWKDVSTDPLSTFSIDVDRAGYSIMRRFVEEGNQPPQGAIRLEELVNYFDYSYQSPTDNKPFTVQTNLVSCPWNPKHLLARVAMQAKRINTTNLPASNLVFLIDVSGSMQDENKLPLLQESMKLLVHQLRPQDRVAMVVYAGSSGLVLPSTSAANENVIKQAIDNLQAGGSTNGAEGITQAYAEAVSHFIKDGNNRIIWATDGDFNVGLSSTDGLVKLVEEKRKQGVFLTMLGFGQGNYKDNRMEQIADKGNGNYAYIDNLSEAKKVLVREFSGSIFTIAKDVKLQIEFNPGKVKRWKQLGYENRALATADFKDDAKDAGELGAGHAVTAFYEIDPAEQVTNSSLHVQADEPFRYQQRTLKAGEEQNEWMLIKARYKEPTQTQSIPLQWALTGNPQSLEQSSESMRFAVGVLCFAKKLRKEDDVQKLDWSWLTSTLSKSLGNDNNGERAEFLSLVHKAKNLS